MAAVLHLGEVVVSHRSAARFHEFDGFKDAQVIEVTTQGPRKLGRGTIVHRSDVMSPGAVWVRGCVAVTDPARTLIDLGAVVDAGSVEIALDSALRRRKVTVGQLDERLQQIAARGRRGTGVLRQLLVERDPSRLPESPPETLFLRICRDQKLPLPVPQFPLGRYRLDFAYPDRKIAIEIDSLGWHSDSATMAADRHKQNFLVAEGWIPIRFMSFDVSRRPDYVGRTIKEALGVTRLFD